MKYESQNSRPLIIFMPLRKIWGDEKILAYIERRR